MSTRIIALPVNAGKEPLIFNTIWQAGKFFWPNVSNLALLNQKVKLQIEKGTPIMAPSQRNMHYFLDYCIELNDAGRLGWDDDPAIISLRKYLGIKTKIEDNKLTVIKEA